MGRWGDGEMGRQEELEKLFRIDLSQSNPVNEGL
jgi:hypothetical protein